MNKPIIEEVCSEVEWKPIPGAEIYEVSNDGRVRRSPSAPPAINTHPGRLLRPDCASGYARVALRANGKLHRELVHRLVARAFLEPARPFAHVNHKDGNKLNNRVENLEWCTPQENVHHAWRTGLCRPLAGENHGCAKLSEADVIRIREARTRGVKLSAIAQVFNVAETTISTIDRNQTWTHL